MELHDVPIQIALATPAGWDLHDARLTDLNEEGAVAEVHFDLPDLCVDQAVFLEVQLHGEPFVALCEHQPPEHRDPGALYLRFVDPDEVHDGSFGELIDVHKQG